MTLTLLAHEVRQLREAAANAGLEPELFVAEAIRERLHDDAAWVEAVEAGMAELEADGGVSIEEYGSQMDAFLAALEVKTA